MTFTAFVEFKDGAKRRVTGLEEATANTLVEAWKAEAPWEFAGYSEEVQK